MERKEIIDLMLSRLNRDIDLSWSEISTKTGMNVSDSHIRKMAYGVRLYDEYLKENEIKTTDPKKIEILNEKILELKKTRQQLSDERTYTNKKIRSIARIEDFVDLLRDELILLADEKSLEVKKQSSNIKNKDSGTGLLLLSDIHYGIENDNKVNKYNPNIAKERMEYLIDKVLEHCKTHNITELYVVDLGDTLSGHIHNNLRLENRMGVAQQIVGVAELISNALFKLSNELDLVHFGMVEGNHDRILPLKQDNLNKDSFSVLVQELIKERTNKINNLLFHESNCETYLQLNIENKICTFVHGDKDKPNNAISGIKAITGIHSDYIFMGHFHNANEFTDNQSEIIVNGSFAGTDEYAFNLRKNSPAIQKFMVMNKNGRECTYNINVNC